MAEHSCCYDTLYHSRRNDRDRENECDRGISSIVPFSAVPVSSDIGRHVVSLLGAVHSRVEGIEWLKHVERSRIRVEQLTEER